MKTKIKRILLFVITLLLSVISAYIGVDFLMESGLDSGKRLLYAICFLGYPVCTLFLIVIIIALIKLESESKAACLIKIWKILRIITILFAFLSSVMGQILISPWYDKTLYQMFYLMIPMSAFYLDRMSLHKVK